MRMPDSSFTQKEMLIRLMEDMREVRDTQINHTGELETIKVHTSETNGKVAQAIIDIAELEKTVFKEDNRQFWRLIKYGGIALTLTSFLFIQESRDFILGLLSII
jgi:hypothetical protein